MAHSPDGLSLCVRRTQRCVRGAFWMRRSWPSLPWSVFSLLIRAMWRKLTLSDLQPYIPCLDRSPPHIHAHTPSHPLSNPHSGAALMGGKRKNSLIYIRPEGAFLLWVPSNLCTTPWVSPELGIVFATGPNQFFYQVKNGTQEGS